MEKVLFLIKAREFGGLEVVLLDWLSCVDFSKTSVVVCAYKTDILATKLAAAELPVECIQLTIPDDAAFLRAFPAWLRLLRSIRARKIVFLEGMVGDFGVIPVIAAGLVNRGGIYLLEANWGRDVAFCSSGKRKLHYGFLPGIGLYRHKERARQRLRALFAHETFVVSSGIRTLLVAHYGYPADRTSVLYHGVNTARYLPSPADRLEFRQAQGIPPDAMVVVSHGRLVRRKRVERILKAFDALAQEHQNLWVLLTAYGPTEGEIREIASRCPARDRIKLIGFQDDPSKILKASDIYVLSSNDEGFGIALVEALSTGLVCVATCGPGPTDILADGENGFLVAETDEGVLAGLQRALKLGPVERSRMVERGRRTAESRFEIKDAIRRALDALGIPAR